VKKGAKAINEKFGGGGDSEMSGKDLKVLPSVCKAMLIVKSRVEERKQAKGDSARLT